METKPVRDLLQQVIGTPLREIPDHFVTAYANGDFLSIHNDGNSGSQAWIINLSKDWAEEHGGQLKFTCAEGRSFNPKFNSLITFNTRPSDLPHTVLPVKPGPRQERPRFAITGWYMAGDDQFSEAERQQNNLMRERL